MIYYNRIYRKKSSNWIPVNLIFASNLKKNSADLINCGYTLLYPRYTDITIMHTIISYMDIKEQFFNATLKLWQFQTYK